MHTGNRTESPWPRLVVASVGQAIGPCAYSSLAAARTWLTTDTAWRFMRAYRRARSWLLATPPAQVADLEAGFFPDFAPAVLRNLPNTRMLDA